MVSPSPTKTCRLKTPKGIHESSYMLKTSFCVVHTLPVGEFARKMATLKILVSMSLLWATLLQAAPRNPRLSLAARNPSYYFSDVDGIPGTYSFGYDVLDPETGNTQFRTEEKYPNGTVIGSYGYVDARGRSRRVDYIADEKGYRLFNDVTTKKNAQYVQVPDVTTEATVSWTRPRKSNKKKNPIKTPSIVLEPPRFLD